MADNVDFTSPVYTAAADDISGVLFQRIKLAIGADGVNDGDVSSTNPLPVLVDDSTPIDIAVTGEIAGNVGGYIASPSANFTRPADTTAYASGDLIANSTTAGSVTPMSFTAARTSGGSLMIRRARLVRSGTGSISARLHLYTASPTPANGDNGAFSTDQAATYLGAFDFTTDSTFTDGVVGFGIPVVGSDVSVKLSSGQTIYGLLEARAAFTPTSAGTFTVTLDVLQN